jgi:CubicO group peptidase (beta-lactamase class C family)
MATWLRRRLETLVRTPPAAAVTTIAREADPTAVGMAAADVAAIGGALAKVYESGLYPALALCIRRRGQVIVDRAIGHAAGNAPHDPRDARKVLATPSTLFSLFSASKMVTAMMVHLCDQQGLLHLDDPVAHYIPEFGKHGKAGITLRHVLTHRAGIPRIPSQFADVGLLDRPDEILALLCDQKPTWAPGRRLAYHAVSGGYVLGAVIERVAGVPLREFLARNVLRPLGFDAFNYGVPAARMAEVARNAFTGPPVVPPLSIVIKRALSVQFVEAVRISNDPRFLTGVVPAGNVIATANEACRFMQLLVGGGELDGVRVFEERTIRRAVAEQTYLELDLTMGAPIRYSMGFMLGSKLSVYGLHTEHVFGHLGFTNVFVYADPTRDLAVALMTSGKPALSVGLTRIAALMQAIAGRTPRDARGRLT